MGTRSATGHEAIGDTGHILAMPVYFWNLVSHRIAKVQSPQASSTLRDCKCESPLLGSRHGPGKAVSSVPYRACRRDERGERVRLRHSVRNLDELPTRRVSIRFPAEVK